MVNDRYIELINKKLDGTITAKERADLDSYLAESHEAQKVYADMAALGDLLHRLERVDPPRELKSEILNTIDHARYETERECPAKPSRWRTKFNLRYAYSFAAGLIIGVAVYALSTGPMEFGGGHDLTRLAGTIISGDKLPDMRSVDKHEFKADGLDGALEVKIGDNLIVVALNVVADREIELFFKYDPNAITLAGYRQMQNQTGSLHSTFGNLRVTHTGENDYVFVFCGELKQTPAMVFEIHSEKLLFKRTLKIMEVTTR